MKRDNFSIKTLDGISYLQYTFNEHPADGVGLRMLTRARIPGILPASVWKYGDEESVRFSIGARIPLSEAVNRTVPGLLRGVVTGICDAVVSASGYMLDPAWVRFEDDLIFCDPSDGSAELLCIPEPDGRGCDWRSAVGRICLSPPAGADVNELGLAAAVTEILERIPDIGAQEIRRIADGFCFAGSAEEPLELPVPVQKRPVLRTGSGKTVRIDSTPFSIGRDKGCALRFDSADVSRRHAEILFCGGCCFIRDLSSKNGTRVNGIKPEKGFRRLEHGDVIAFAGETAVFLKRE